MRKLPKMKVVISRERLKLKNPKVGESARQDLSIRRGTLLARRDFLPRLFKLSLAGISSIAIRTHGTNERSRHDSPKRDTDPQRVLETPKGTYKIHWEDSSIELNLIPMNPRVTADAGVEVEYVHVRPDLSILASPISDLVGIVGLSFDGAPRIPRICWDNREHHFWEGFEGTYEPRNVVVNAPEIETDESGSLVRASYYFVANHVKTGVAWEFLDPKLSPYKFAWNTAITVENLTHETLKSYFQFFACYHQRGTNYYWDSSNEIKPCSNGGFNATRDAETARILRASPYHSHMERYRADREILYVRYANPILISEKREWFGGLRHLILVDPKRCASIVTWFEQARDYTISPPDFDFKPGEKFTAQIRHIITSVESVNDLKKLWAHFEKGVLA